MKALPGVGADNSVWLGQLTHHTWMWVLLCSEASHTLFSLWPAVDSQEILVSTFPEVL